MANLINIGRNPVTLVMGWMASTYVLSGVFLFHCTFDY